MSKALVVAIDDGYAQTKVVGMSLEPDGALVKRIFRTSVRGGRLGLKATKPGSGGSSVGAYKTEEGEEFTISDQVESENTQFDGFHVSTMNRALVTHALFSSGYGGRDVEVWTGLPVGDYFRGNGEVNDDRIEEKKRNLMKGIEIVSSRGPLARIAQIDVGCQAVSAWVDFMIDDNLDFRSDRDGQVAIVDVGGRTTDIAVVVNSDGTPYIDYSKSGTATVGVLDVHKALVDAVRGKFGLRDDFPSAVVDKAVRTGQMEIYGETNDISDLVAAAVRDVEGKVKREIDRRIGQAAALRNVVFVGGGSALLKNVAGAFRNGVMAEDPEFANARGLLKYARANAVVDA